MVGQLNNMYLQLSDVLSAWYYRLDMASDGRVTPDSDRAALLHACTLEQGSYLESGAALTVSSAILSTCSFCSSLRFSSSCIVRLRPKS